ncbi:hypothetical protein D9M68_758340 [compost metagenome]
MAAAHAAARQAFGDLRFEGDEHTRIAAEPIEHAFERAGRDVESLHGGARLGQRLCRGHEAAGGKAGHGGHAQRLQCARQRMHAGRRTRRGKMRRVDRPADALQHEITFDGSVVREVMKGPCMGTLTSLDNQHRAISSTFFEQPANSAYPRRARGRTVTQKRV